MISSAPSLVSRASPPASRCGCWCGRQRTTLLSEIRIESSKLPPFQGMNATSMFWPMAIHPGRWRRCRPPRHPDASISHADDRTLVDVGVLDSTLVLMRLMSTLTPWPVSASWHRIDAGGDVVDHAATARRHDGAGIDGRHALDARAPAAFGAQHGHGLARHVRRHQRAVGVVVLQEGHSDAATETICAGERPCTGCAGADQHRLPFCAPTPARPSACRPCPARRWPGR